ncbi:MAG TPA: hypothetical protein VNR17_07015 [Luteimicrobium sp.]|nr:hypothetical protein [Luteimicrobium sp.]
MARRTAQDLGRTTRARTSRRVGVRAGAVGVALAGALTLAACGSSGGGYGGGAGGKTATGGGGMSTGGAVQVEAHSGQLGTYLTDQDGRTLYLFVIDKNGKSACDGACAAAWPPLTVTGKPTAGKGVTSSELTTVTRSDGSTQVRYDEHPLYYYAGDTSAGSTAGQGVDGYGGLWWVVDPSGAAITGTAGSGGSSPSSSDSSGYTY